MTSDSQVLELIESTVTEHGLPFARHDADGRRGIVVTLSGERRHSINTLLAVGAHGVWIEVFVCRRPDENFEGVYRHLLRRNRRLYGVAYTLDDAGDIYLVGRLALEAVTADEVDRLLGQVLEAVDFDFNVLLELGFRTSIQKEWAWRLSRGESVKNLQAFEHLRPTEAPTGKPAQA